MKKLLSVFLALLMVFGLFTVAVIPASALTGSGTQASPYVIMTYSSLKDVLSKKNTTSYIKIGEAIKGTAVETLSVYGTKYLDLNGYELNMHLESKDNRYMFDVYGKMEINDSSATGKSYDGKGKITFDNKVYKPSSKSNAYIEFTIQRNVFNVKEGGTLVLNKGKIIPGCSSKEWMYDARQAGNANKVYNGNAYVQINGKAVTVNSKGKFIMNGGQIEGRGFSNFDIEEGYGDRLCAIYSYTGGSVYVNGGKVIGKGGANVFGGNRTGVVIRAGSFETEKIDAVWVARAKYKIVGVSTYRNVCIGSGYGQLNIEASAFKEGLNNTSIEITRDGKSIITKGTTWSVPSDLYKSNKNLKVEPYANKTGSIVDSSGERFANLNHIYGVKTILKSDIPYYFPTDNTVNSSRLRITLSLDGRTIAEKVFDKATQVYVDDIYDYEVGKVYKVEGYLDQTFNGDYSLSCSLNPITVTVKENKISVINIDCTKANVNGNLLKVGEGLTINALNLKSLNSGADIAFSKNPTLGGKEVLPSAEIVDNGEYTLSIKVTAKKGYAISTATELKILGTTTTIRSYRGNVGYATLTLKAECTHPTKKAQYDSSFHFTKCSVCSQELNKEAHVFDKGVIDGYETKYSCTKCNYSYTTDNGREGFSAVCIESKQYAVGEEIPVISQIVPSYYGERYSVSYQWYKNSVAEANKVNAGERFESCEYYLTVTGTVTNSEKYYFEEGANVVSIFFTEKTANTATPTKVTTTFKVIPLQNATGEIIFPDAPAINSSLLECVKQTTLKLTDDKGNKIKGDYGLWVYENESGKAQITYAVEYDEVTDTLNVVKNEVFKDITNVKVRANVTYSYNLFGPVGLSFNDMQIKGGKGADKAEFEDNFLGAKGVFGFWEYTADPVIKAAYIEETSFNPGQPASEIKPSGNSNFTLTYSYEGLNAGIIPCDKDSKVIMTLTAKEGCSFAQNDNLSVYIGSENTTITKRESDTKIVTEYTIKLSGHNLTSQKIVNPTCTKAGSTTAYCSNCKNTITIATTKASGHKYEKLTVCATTAANGATMSKCKNCSKEESKTTIYKIKTVKLSKSAMTYTGKAQKPTVTVTDSKGKKLKSGTDYSITYSNAKSKATGRYTVTVTFKGKYQGEKVLSYTIAPKSPTNLKVTSTAKKTAKITYKKATGASGYEIYYATKKNGTYKSMKSLTGTSYTNKKLTSGKTYYVKVRAYKTVGVEKIYGAFCSAQKVTIKKK